jgi:hypothetical protein
MHYEWKLIYIGNTETVGQNGLQKRTIVLEEHTEKQYKWSLTVDLIKEKVDLINDYKLLDIVKVYLNTRATRNDDTWKYYNGINWWKIDLIEKHYDVDDEYL